MSTLYRLHGIILNRHNLGEVDRRITLLAPSGKYELRARGTQKLGSKLAGSIEPLTLVELTIARGRMIDQITGAVVKDHFEAVRANLARLAAASLIASTAEILIKGFLEEPRAYEKALHTLNLISQSTTNREIFMAMSSGLWNLLAVLGHHPSEKNLPRDSNAREMITQLLREGSKIQTLKSTVKTARASVDAAIDFSQEVADQAIPSVRFFKQLFSSQRQPLKPFQ